MMKDRVLLRRQHQWPFKFCRVGYACILVAQDLIYIKIYQDNSKIASPTSYCRFGLPVAAFRLIDENTSA